MSLKLFVFLLCFGASTMLAAQAVPTGVQTGDVLIGAGYVRANPDYSPQQMNGFVVYGDVDFAKYVGAVAEFHRVASTSLELSETTYEVGLRSRLVFGRIGPYVKGTVGEGSFSFTGSSQNGSHMMFAGGGGVEYRLSHRIYICADYEYQRWSSFPPRGLQPNLASFGVAYRLM